MNVLVTGGTGFIGRALVPALLAAGHNVSVLSRGTRSSLPETAQLVQSLEGLSEPVDAVINLAGASLADKRWNAAYKAEITRSRLDMTQALGDFFSQAGYTPSIWLNASAIGYYGPRDDEALGEGASAGEGFAAALCQQWEQAARDAAGKGRLCILRLGVVLDRDGGAYDQMAQPFRFGVANWVGSGEQWLSWIHREDVVSAMLFLLHGDGLSGVFNVTAPAPERARQFCESMKSAHRTFVTLPMPAPVMRMMLGEMADELLITGQRVVPAALQSAGFEFSYATAAAAIAAIEGQ